jgi:hypothetical protein
MERASPQETLKVVVQEADMARASQGAMRVRWSTEQAAAEQDFAAYDVNLILESGRVLQLAQSLPAEVHELLSSAAAAERARVQVVGVRARDGALAQGVSDWLELPGQHQLQAEHPPEPSAQESMTPRPVISSVQPYSLRAGTNPVTIRGQNLPLAFGYTITNLQGQPVFGTGAGFPTGTSYEVRLDLYVSASVPPGSYLLRVTNSAGSASAPISIATALQAPTITSLDPSIIYPDNSGSTRQLIVNGSNLPTSLSGFSVSSPYIGLSLVFPNPNSAVLYLSNLLAVPSGRYALTARSAAGSATAYFDIVRFF